MSTLREDVEDVCVSSNSQHGFAVVLDDESSTFEISSSNSLPTSTGAASTVGVVAVDDSSSTDTINDGPVHASHSQVFFNDPEEDAEDPPVVCLINDDDDEDEDDPDPEPEPEPEDEEDEELVEDDDDEVVDIAEAAIDCTNTSQLALADGTIMAADGSKIFLETPVVEEAQPHPGQVAVTSQSELTGKPKRLSDEFLLGEEEQTEPQAQARGGIKSEAGGSAVDDQPSEGDRLMSVRLKQMSITANAVSNPSSANTAAAAAASREETASTSTSSSRSSSHSSSGLTKAEMESMDLIERRDFETEQRLTGGLILRTSAMVGPNKLSLSLIKSLAAGRAAAGASNASNASNSDDWPSSSNGRTVSSDSKVS